MLTNLKYSWLFFLRGGWRALFNVILLFIMFGIIGTMLSYYMNVYSIHIAVVMYLLLYFDNASVRFTSPLELTHLLPFPESGMQKYLRLVTIEATGLKLYLILAYLLIQCIVNRLYMHPEVFLISALCYIGYHFIFLPFLLIAKRKGSFVMVFKAFAPVVFLIPILLLRKQGSKTKFLTSLDHFFNHHLLVIGLSSLVLCGICFIIGYSAFKKIQYTYPFMDEELVEKLRTRKRF